MSAPSESKQAAVIQAKAEAAGPLSKTLLPFLSPEVCADASARVLYPNANARAACPVYQKGIIETSTVDIGNHQNRAVLLVPHMACPIMFSHSALSAVALGLFQASTTQSGRLRDPCPGRYGGSEDQPLYSAHEIPQHVDFTVPGASIALPIHGGFYTANTQDSTSSQRNPAAIMFRDWTTVMDATGVPSSVRAIPGLSGDSVRITLVARASAAWVAGDLTLDVVTTNVGGTSLTTTSAALTPTSATSPAVLAGSVTLPVGAVGIVSVILRATVIKSVDFSSVCVIHSCNSSTAPAGVQLGTFVGSPISGFASLKPVASAARVTSLSLKVTNTSSALNANGFIIGFATQGVYPGNTGCFGENTISGLVSAKSFKFIDGSYMALAPALDLQFSNVDTLPDYGTGIGMYLITGQDNTAITMKCEYHAVVEIVSQDPLFAPMPAGYHPEFLTAVKSAQESGGYLVLSENPFHWGVIGSLLGKAKKALTSPFAKQMVSAADKLGIPFAHQAQMAEDFLSSSRPRARNAPSQKKKKPASKPKHNNPAHSSARRPTQTKPGQRAGRPSPGKIKQIERMLENL